jgi:hypothetical protein
VVTRRCGGTTRRSREVVYRGGGRPEVTILLDLALVLFLLSVRVHGGQR